LLKVLGGAVTDRIPIWLMRQAGRYLPEYRDVRQRAGGFLDLCFDPALAAEVTLQPIRRFGMDGAILFSDILVIPHALGQSVAFTEGEGPILEPIDVAASIARLSADRLHERLAPVYETVERVAGLLPSATSLIGLAGAPWTVASYMVEGGTSRDFGVVKAWAVRDPVGFGQLIALLVEATVAYLIRQVACGAEVLQLFESWAGVLSEQEFRKWSIGPVSAIVARVKGAYPQVPIIGFPRGAGLGYREFVEKTGIDAVGLDSSVPLAWAAEELQPSCALQGNLDPALLLVGGDRMKHEAERILAAWGCGPFIFNFGHGVMQGTPPENVASLVDFVRQWRM